jgi:hypothetical protein
VQGVQQLLERFVGVVLLSDREVGEAAREGFDEKAGRLRAQARDLPVRLEDRAPSFRGTRSGGRPDGLLP